jgi:hypothetical protein
LTRPVEGRISAGFDQPRPIGAKKTTHPHGAIDIVPSEDLTIKAPESGSVFAYLAVRYEPGNYWPEFIEVHGRGFPFLNYFYDMFGGILVLQAHNGDPRVITRTHVFAHSWGNQIFNSGLFEDRGTFWIEEGRQTRWPVHATYTEKVIVEEGQPIGRVGNAGFSTGKHLHWEIHEGFTWQRHRDRIDPEEWLNGTV